MLDVLAPERTVVIDGTGDEYGTYIDHFWAKNALVSGYTEAFDRGAGPCGAQ